MWNSHHSVPQGDDYVHAVLAVTKVKELDHLDVVADKVMEVTRPAKIAMVSCNPIPKDTSLSSDLAAVVERPQRGGGYKNGYRRLRTCLFSKLDLNRAYDLFMMH